MCPCVLLDKLKSAFSGVKKGKKSKEKAGKKSKEKDNSASVEAKTSPSEQTRSKNSGQEKSGASRKKEPQSENSNSDKSKLVELEALQDKVVLVGQPQSKKGHPKDYLRKILNSERPDLVNPDLALNEDDLLALEIHLVTKGEMRGGINLILGEITQLDSDVDIGSGNTVTVVMLYAHGRFGAVYMIHKELSEAEKANNVPSILAMKTSRRMYCPSRIDYEIEILSHLYPKREPKKAKKSKESAEKCYPTHITPVLYHGTSGGTSFMVCPMMDASLEKIRQECQAFPKGDSFYLGQEALLGLKECHERDIVHRDFKPTNIVLGTGDGDRSWWLCDFGDACRINEKRVLSFPDNFTLPYLSRAAHGAFVNLVPATIWWDLESWFYFVLEFFVPLPWEKITEEAETLAAKNTFWTSLDDFFQKNAEKLPSQVPELAQKIAEGNADQIHSKLTKILRDGFEKNIEKPWMPIWLKARKKTQSVQQKLPEKPAEKSAEKTDKGADKAGKVSKVAPSSSPNAPTPKKDVAFRGKLGIGMGLGGNKKKNNTKTEQSTSAEKTGNSSKEKK